MPQSGRLEGDDLEEKVAELERKIDEDPDNPEFHKELGNVFHRSRAFDLALTEYRNAIRVDPGYYPAVYNLGNTYYETGDFTQAIIAWQRALLIKPDLEMAVYNIGFTNYQLGVKEKDKDKRRRLFEDAILCFQRALDMDPGHADTHLHLGLTWYELERYDDAIGCYERALELSPDDGTVHYNLGNVYYEKGDDDRSYYKRALEEYKLASKFDSRDLKSANNIADCFLRLGELTKARKQIQKVLDKHPDYLPAHCTLGEIFSKEGNSHAAIGEFEMVIAMDEDEGGILHKYAGQALIDEYTQLVARTPDDQDLRLRLGRAYKILGLAYHETSYLEQAVLELEKAAGTGAQPFLELAEIYVVMRRFELALGALDAALDKEPDSLVGMALKAECFCRMGDRDRTIEVLRQIRKQRLGTP